MTNPRGPLDEGAALNPDEMMMVSKIEKAARAKTSGQILTTLMARAGLTQSEMARRMGRHRNEIYKWASGLSCPNASSLVEIWAVLKEEISEIQLSDLVGGDDALMMARVEVAARRSEGLSGPEEVRDGDEIHEA